jgi:hypothetical protein
MRKMTVLSLTLLVLFLLAAVASCGGKTVQAPAAASPAVVETGPLAASPVAAGPASGQPEPATIQPGTPSAPSGASPSGAQPGSSPATAPAASGGSPAVAAPSGTTPSGSGQAVPETRRKLGELVFAEGSVAIHRAGAAVEPADIGSVVRAYDVLVTGPASRAEVDLGAGSAGGASVKLAENTAFYFDTKELGEQQRKTVLQLLSGSLAIKVDKLANGSFQVGTDQAVLGVRGTVFIVDTIPDGSLLVTCETGAVAVTEGGSTTTAKPGAAVEMPSSGAPRTVTIEPADLGAWRNGWRADAYASFATKALSYTSSYAAALDSGKPGFDAAYAKLKAQTPALDAWRTARAAGKQPRFTDWIAEKKAVSAALFDCLKALFALERPYYRLVELKTLHKAGTGVGSLKDGRSSAQYFDAFESSNASLELGMARVREALMLFSWASAGSPLGDFFGSKAASLGTGALLLED